MVCGAASRCRSYAAAALPWMSIGVMRPGARVAVAAAARIDQFDQSHCLFCLGNIAALRARVHRSPGVRPGSEKRFLGAFVKFSSMSKLGFTK